MTRAEAVQVVSCVYGACIEDGAMDYADRIIADLQRCFPEIDWDVVQKKRED